VRQTSRRVLRRVSLLAILLLLAAAPAAASGPRALERPSRSEISEATGAIRDAPLRAGADTPTGFWGGTYTTSTNEQVTIYASDAYAADDAANRRWAEFLASLIHGAEISRVTVYLAPPAQVAGMCGGADILGCYARDRLVVPGEDTVEVSAESVLAHEYGHAIAENRSNDPWPALAWGTKRWASYEQVCRRARARELFPGAEAPLLYLFNPGEAFAETYRLLNERRAGRPETPWRVVDPSLEPDARDLALVDQDVRQPWTANRQLTLNGRFGTRGRPVRSFAIATPLDGRLSATVSTSARVRIEVRAGKKTIARGTSNVATTVCGPRRLTLRVTRLAGPGSFTVSVSLP
jgi:hypothetical protein